MELSRRRALSLAGLSAVGATGTVGVGGSVLRDGGGAAAAHEAAAAAVPFYGEHQAGITTPAQDRLHFVAFDVITDKRAELVDLLREWTLAAARMTAGREAGVVGAVSGAPEAPPDDTGEALGLPPSALTLTVGFGPLCSVQAGTLEARRAATRSAPRSLSRLPSSGGTRARAHRLAGPRSSIPRTSRRRVREESP